MYAYACVGTVSQSARRLSGSGARVIETFLPPSCCPVGMRAHAKQSEGSVNHMHCVCVSVQESGSRLDWLKPKNV